ncbi:unnamed protein product [Calicophoron daubneyi]|uniref:Fructose-2,6-bisphosphatase TIGAR n=1 Tax=Calicophoron daubneyi TaxID=300641 RepID=A0AAV2T849_CALDB
MGPVIYSYLTFIRHGETAANVGNIIQGHLDTELSNVGLEQAKALKQYFRDLPVDMFYSSDLKRASFTANELGISVPLRTSPQLRERNFGKFCGSSRADLQKFAESTADSKTACDNWRAVNAECSHQVACRTQEFINQLFFQLAARLEKGTTPKLVASGALSPILNRPSMPLMPEPVLQFFPGQPQTNFIYAGHVLIVSHGGWIRQALRLLGLHSTNSLNFSKEMAHSVMKNCGISQIGVSFDLEEMDIFRRKSASRSSVVDSPLPLFGTQLESNLSSAHTSSCPYARLANPHLPISTVCYHFNLTKSQLDGGPKISLPVKSINPSDALCSKMEVIFADDDDEYSGQPSGSS